jgi:hypothetical protein
LTGLRGLDDRHPAVDADGQVIQVGIVLEDDGLDGLCLGLAGLDVGGLDLVAGFELADGDGGTGGEQDPGGRGEAVITARVDGIACVRIGAVVGGGFFCGKDTAEGLNKLPATAQVF